MRSAPFSLECAPRDTAPFESAAGAKPRLGIHWCAVRLAVCLGVMTSPGFASAQSSLVPTGVFLQWGSAGSTHAASVGTWWGWGKEWALAGGTLSGYWEGSLSAWSYPGMDGRRTSWLGQLGLVPVFRYRPEGPWSKWFGELGIGLTLTTTVYETQGKRFSTSFNFGDHVAIGRSYGSSDQHELALRAQHFSNAGIRQPNPGLNFVQLRYSYTFP